MKRILLIVGFSLLWVLGKSQTCVQVSCPDTVPYTSSSDTLRSNFVGYTPTSIMWKQIAGLPSTIVNPNSQNTAITGLQPGQLYVYSQTSVSGNFSGLAYTSVFVKAVPVVPPVQRSAKSVLIIYDNNTTQNLP